jgi:2-amino-4-hydroxy-6-hydroxymethyldihydropteridine diphosphokinase
VRMLHLTTDIHIQQSSTIYETDPVGYVEQDPFLNVVVKAQTELSAANLLRCTQGIENELGRTRDIRWGPRTLDIDILLYNHLFIREGNLQVPHPRMCERAFVIIPLAEIAPDVLIPLGRREQVTAAEVLAHVEGKEGVRPWKPLSWENIPYT